MTLNRKSCLILHTLNPVDILPIYAIQRWTCLSFITSFIYIKLTSFLFLFLPLLWLIKYLQSMFPILITSLSPYFFVRLRSRFLPLVPSNHTKWCWQPFICCSVAFPTTYNFGHHFFPRFCFSKLMVLIPIHLWTTHLSRCFFLNPYAQWPACFTPSLRYMEQQQEWHSHSLLAGILAGSNFLEGRHSMYKEHSPNNEASRDVS